MNEVYIFLISVLSGALSGIGIGGGAILLIFMSLFLNMPQLRAQYINLIYFIPTAFMALIIHRRNKLIVYNIAITTAVFGVIGAIIGAYVATMLDAAILKKIFGILLFYIGFGQLFKK